MKNKNYELIDNYIEKLMKESTPDKPIWNIENIRQGKKAHWNYIDGCMMTSLLSLYNETKHQEYFNFVDNYIDYYIFDEAIYCAYGVRKGKTFHLGDKVNVICSNVDIEEAKITFVLLQNQKKFKIEKRGKEKAHGRKYKTYRK